MKVVYVGIPILKDSRRIHVEKGQRWNILEHSLLENLARDDHSLKSIIDLSSLPRRVIVEILTRLMRVGWVELTSKEGILHFRATAIGRAAASQSILPPVVRPEARHVSYVVELLTGTVFRPRDISLIVTKDSWHDRVGGLSSIRIETPEHTSGFAPSLTRITNLLLRSDEELMRVDPKDHPPQQRLAVATVRGDQVEGLGSDLPDELLQHIFSAATKAPETASSTSISLPVAPIRHERKLRPIKRHIDDLLIGASAHRDAFEAACKKCRNRMIIHSTFVDFEKTIQLLEALKVPINRGAKIDILYGQTSEQATDNGSLIAILRLKDHLRNIGVSDRIRVHTSPTKSHGKILVYDNGNPKEYTAIIGSCNWLSSGFHSFEVSMRFRENEIVADIFSELADLCRPVDGHISDLSVELVRLAKTLQRDADDHVGANGTATLILGAEHGDILLQARDSAQKRILLLSHRLGLAARPTIVPLVTSAREHNVEAEIYYGRVSFPVTGSAAAEEKRKLKTENVDINAVENPRIHAKVLAWDDNDIVITSQNWLSADPARDNLHQEIGVHVSMKNIGKRFAEAFRIAKDFQ